MLKNCCFLLITNLIKYETFVYVVFLPPRRNDVKIRDTESQRHKETLRLCVFVTLSLSLSGELFLFLFFAGKKRKETLDPCWQNRRENIKKVSAHGDFLSDESFNYHLSNVNRIRYQRTILRYKSQIHMDSVARPVWRIIQAKTQHFTQTTVVPSSYHSRTTFEWWEVNCQRTTVNRL